MDKTLDLSSNSIINNDDTNYDEIVKENEDIRNKLLDLNEDNIILS